MNQRFRFSLATVLLGVTCCALAIGWWSTVEWPHSNNKTFPHYPSDTAIRELPISIAASEVGDFASGYSWYLSVNSAGQADLTIENDRKGRVQQFTVSEKQLNELRENLVFHAFFALDDEYGEIVAHGSTQSLTICVGEWTKTVRINYLANWLNYDRAKLPEPARALCVWMPIRGWFHHPDAVDKRKYDQAILDAVKGHYQ